MNIQISKETLLPALTHVCGIVEKRQTLPILGNVYIKTNNNQLTLIGSDLETEITTTLNNIIAVDGETTVSARKLFDICRSLKDESMISITIEEKKMLLTSGRSRFSLQTLSAKEYPLLDTSENEFNFSIQQKDISALLNSTAYAMAQQDVRYFLNGLLLEVGQGVIKAVSTDGHRLAKNQINHSELNGEVKQSIVPRKAVQEISKFLNADSEDLIQIGINSSHISIKTDGYQFISKLIDGRYPEYQKVIPNNLDKNIILDKTLFGEILSRTAILSNEKFRGISIKFTAGSLIVTSRNPDHEEASDEMTIDYQGEDVEIGFNVNYLLDAVRGCSSETIQFEFKDSSSSGIIRESSADEKIALIMPMRI
ncbi:MAG: DNA polymerase III subunit beta [Arenicella sp.]